MGLGGMKYAWQRQTKDFAHTKGDQYSSLVTDNRGIGDSDKPKSRYSTTEMAKDLVEVVDHLGWTSKRELHVIGISMGGMIAQEIVRPLNLRNTSSAEAMQCLRHACCQALGSCTTRSTTLVCQGYQTFSEPLRYPAISVACTISAPLHPTPTDLPACVPVFQNLYPGILTSIFLL
jgi:hypothetical protein